MQIAAETITPFVYFVDVLDWLDYVTFDSGPGQMMLKAIRFFVECDTRETETLDIKAKVQKLMDLYEEGERRLKENRESDLEHYRQAFRVFIEVEDFVVTPETQRSLRLG